MTTLIVHRTAVTLPTEFTAHRLQRMFLTRRHATRMTLPAVMVARKAVRHAPVVADCTGELQPHTWPWALASMLIVLAVVAGCGVVVGL